MIGAPTGDEEQQRISDLYALDLLDGSDDPVLSAVTRLAGSLFDVPIALVSLVAEESQWFIARSGLQVQSTPRDQSFCAHAILGADVLVVEDARCDDRFCDNPLVLGPPHIVFYAGAPVRAPSGSVLGTVCLIDRRPRTLHATGRAHLRDFATIVEEAIARRAMSVTDPLTGLYDRRGFDRALAQGVALSDRDKVTVTLAYADLDGLKAINDEHGHAAGDAAISKVADVLRSECRTSDVLARLGGDEFAVLMFDTAGAAALVDRLAAELSPLSMSVATVDHRPGETPDELLERADQAMYGTKASKARRPD